MNIKFFGMSAEMAQELVIWLKNQLITPHIDADNIGWNINFQPTKEIKITFDDDCISINTKYESIDIEKTDFMNIEIQ